jgi:hypothetical protein
VRTPKRSHTRHEFIHGKGAVPYRHVIGGSSPKAANHSLITRIFADDKNLRLVPTSIDLLHILNNTKLMGRARMKDNDIGMDIMQNSIRL